MSDALRFVALIVFLVALVATVRQHAAMLGVHGPGGFFAHLGAAGWLILAIASGVTAFRPGSWVLGASTAAVGVLCILIGVLLRAPGRV